MIYNKYANLLNGYPLENLSLVDKITLFRKYNFILQFLI